MHTLNVVQWCLTCDVLLRLLLLLRERYCLLLSYLLRDQACHVSVNCGKRLSLKRLMLSLEHTEVHLLLDHLMLLLDIRLSHRNWRLAT